MRVVLALCCLLALGLPAQADEEHELFPDEDLPSLLDEAPPAGGAETADENAGAESAAPEPAPDADPPLKPAEQRAEQLDILFARLRQPEAAAAGIEKKIWTLWSSSDSPTAEILLRQGQRAMDDGVPDAALSILNRLVGAYPDFAEGWNRRATLYFLMKRYDHSLADIGKVLDLEPRHFGALAGKGMILERQKKYAEARAAYEDALSVNPTLENVKAALKELDRMEQGI